ncbi:phosphoribosylaminoimidazole carboxylase ade2 [Tulasnella sp. JGI-2019a]|nr:phosphoribosylaminoimidazole carboxylase ade2 [Tulasnella sp. JGI-2019a]
MDARVVGILGGGQLGRMLGAAASLLNIQVLILDVGKDSPAKQIISPVAPLEHIDGPFSSEGSIQQLAQQVDVLTVEIEHVNADALQNIINTSPKIDVQPKPETLRVIQNKFIQKNWLKSKGIPVVDYMEVEATQPALENAIDKLGLPFVLKTQILAYDGRGNFVVQEKTQIPAALEALKDRPLYGERYASFSKEIAVMVVRSASGEVRSYPAVETVQKENICHLVFAPLRTSDPQTAETARSVAEQAIRTFSGAGVFGVEMFLMKDGSIIVNEIAPRPHNSGHYTIEACHTSQYENHLRAILSLPLGSTSLKVPSAAMLNLLGSSSDMSEINQICKVALGVPGATVHLYGKAECRKGRKMGHITVVGDSDAQVRERLKPLLLALPLKEIPDASALRPFSPPAFGFDHHQPLVGVIMGSDSDLPTMRAAARVLDGFKIPFELTIVSAHRTPDRMVEYARSASARGLRCIIAGAGGAAHLPGMVAALTSLPVIGVPVKGSSLDGVDSLYSIVQMPRGVPVATVAINNAMNAALLAIRILGAGDPSLILNMDAFMKKQKNEVEDKVEDLLSFGWDQYETGRKDRNKAM